MNKTGSASFGQPISASCQHKSQTSKRYPGIFCQVWPGELQIGQSVVCCTSVQILVGYRTLTGGTDLLGVFG
jgi:hypothetical protein